MYEYLLKIAPPWKNEDDFLAMGLIQLFFKLRAQSKIFLSMISASPEAEFLDEIRTKF